MVAKEESNRSEMPIEDLESVQMIGNKHRFANNKAQPVHRGKVEESLQKEMIISDDYYLQIKPIKFRDEQLPCYLSSSKPRDLKNRAHTRGAS